MARIIRCDKCQGDVPPWAPAYEVPWVREDGLHEMDLCERCVREALRALLAIPSLPQKWGVLRHDEEPPAAVVPDEEEHEDARPDSTLQAQVMDVLLDSYHRDADRWWTVSDLADKSSITSRQVRQILSNLSRENVVRCRWATHARVKEWQAVVPDTILKESNTLNGVGNPLPEERKTDARDQEEV